MKTRLLFSEQMWYYLATAHILMCYTIPGVVYSLGSPRLNSKIASLSTTVAEPKWAECYIDSIPFFVLWEKKKRAGYDWKWTQASNKAVSKAPITRQRTGWEKEGGPGLEKLDECTWILAILDPWPPRGLVLKVHTGRNDSLSQNSGKIARKTQVL